MHFSQCGPGNPGWSRCLRIREGLQGQNYFYAIVDPWTKFSVSHAAHILTGPASVILWVWEVKVSSDLSLHYLGSSWRPCFQHRASSLTPDDWFPNPEPLGCSVSVQATRIEWHRLSGLNNRELLLILEAESLRMGCPEGWFLVRLLFLTCRRLPSHRVLLCLLLLIRHRPFELGPVHMTSFYLNYIFTGLVSEYTHIRG